MVCDSSHKRGYLKLFLTENFFCFVGLKKFMGREYMGISRITYILNSDHTVKEVIEKVNTKSHACDILDIIG